MEWISRDLNGGADKLPRIEDSIDYMLNPSCFACLERCSTTLVVQLLMPSQSHEQGITISFFPPPYWFLVFCPTCQMEVRMESS